MARQVVPSAVQYAYRANYDVWCDADAYAGKRLPLGRASRHFVGSPVAMKPWISRFLAPVGRLGLGKRTAHR
jgi:hypothetical protein